MPWIHNTRNTDVVAAMTTLERYNLVDDAWNAVISDLPSRSPQ